MWEGSIWGAAAGAIVGFGTSALTALGIKERVTKMESEKQDKDSCSRLHQGLCTQFMVMEKHNAEMREDWRALSVRLDGILNQLLRERLPRDG